MKKSRVLLFSLILLSLLAFFSINICTVQAKTRYFNTSCKVHKGKKCTFDKLPHDYVSKDGKLVCKMCGKVGDNVFTD